MQNQEFGPLGTLLIGTIAVMGIAAGLHILVTLPIPENNGAEWMGAIGSIGAIIGTWYATKVQLQHAEKTRIANRMDADIVTAQIAFDLALDTSRVLRNVQRKFDIAHRKNEGLAIGTERLQELQISLRNFGTRDISPHLYAEILCLQRETAYTRTAVTQQNDLDRVSLARTRKATARCAAVFQSKLRVEKLLIQARQAAGHKNFSIDWTDRSMDSDS